MCMCLSQIMRYISVCMTKHNMRLTNQRACSSPKSVFLFHVCACIFSYVCGYFDYESAFSIRPTSSKQILRNHNGEYGTVRWICFKMHTKYRRNVMCVMHICEIISKFRISFEMQSSGILHHFSDVGGFISKMEIVLPEMLENLM